MNHDKVMKLYDAAEKALICKAGRHEIDMDKMAVVMVIPYSFATDFSDSPASNRAAMLLPTVIRVSFLSVLAMSLFFHEKRLKFQPYRDPHNDPAQPDDYDVHFGHDSPLVKRWTLLPRDVVLEITLRRRVRFAVVGVWLPAGATFFL